MRELCTNYGEISGFWWDMNVEKHVDPSINTMIRELQPTAVINDRGFDPGDFGTPERDYDAGGDEVPVFTRRTEACQSVGVESWGYRNGESYYTDRHLLRSIDKYLARDANYLLNVGPAADGTIPAEPVAILRRVGAWYRAVSESFEGATPASTLTANRNVLLTRKSDTVYVHLHRDPVSDAVKLAPLARVPRRATLLNTGEPIACVADMAPSDHLTRAAYLRLTGLPVNTMADTVLVAKLEFDGDPGARPGFRFRDGLTPRTSRGSDRDSFSARTAVTGYHGRRPPCASASPTARPASRSTSRRPARSFSNPPSCRGCPTRRRPSVTPSAARSDRVRCARPSERASASRWRFPTSRGRCRPTGCWGGSARSSPTSPTRSGPS